MILVKCDHCHRPRRVPDGLSGLTVACDFCGKTLDVPQPDRQPAQRDDRRRPVWPSTLLGIFAALVPMVPLTAWQFRKAAASEDRAKLAESRAAELANRPPLIVRVPADPPPQVKPVPVAAKAAPAKVAPKPPATFAEVMAAVDVAVAKMKKEAEDEVVRKSPGGVNGFAYSAARRVIEGGLPGIIEDHIVSTLRYGSLTRTEAYYRVLIGKNTLGMSDLVSIVWDKSLLDRNPARIVDMYSRIGQDDSISLLQAVAKLKLDPSIHGVQRMLPQEKQQLNRIVGADLTEILPRE